LAFSSGADLEKLNIIPTLEKIIESYSNKHDIMWGACHTCSWLAGSKGYFDIVLLFCDELIFLLWF